MALVAAWGRNGCDEGERAALERIERQEPPAIAASDADTRPTLKVYGPTNDKLRRERNKDFKLASVVPHSPRVSYVWDADPPPDVRTALTTLASRVTYIGRSESIVRAYVDDAVIIIVN